MRTLLLVLPLAFSLAGCVSLKVTKASGMVDKTICIVDNPAVRIEFRDAYERQITARGYTAKVIAPGATCPTTSTYDATYGYHWGVYLATARLTINSNGKEVGKAEYRAPFASPEKHGRVEGKIEAMVVELLP